MVQLRKHHFSDSDSSPFLHISMKHRSNVFQRVLISVKLHLPPRSDLFSTSPMFLSFLVLTGLLPVQTIFLILQFVRLSLQFDITLCPVNGTMTGAITS